MLWRPKSTQTAPTGAVPASPRPARCRARIAARRGPSCSQRRERARRQTSPPTRSPGIPPTGSRARWISWAPGRTAATSFAAMSRGTCRDPVNPTLAAMTTSYLDTKALVRMADDAAHAELSPRQLRLWRSRNSTSNWRARRAEKPARRPPNRRLHAPAPSRRPRATQNASRIAARRPGQEKEKRGPHLVPRNPLPGIPRPARSQAFFGGHPWRPPVQH